MKTRTKILLALALYLGITIVLGVLFGSAGKNEEFKPQNEFKLEAWIPIKIGSIDLSVNRAVFYLLLRQWPDDCHHGLDRTADAAEAESGPDRGRGRVRPDPQQHHGRRTSTIRWRSRWFPFVATLFFFIWFSNVIGFLPLPTNTENEIHIFGLAVPDVRDLRGHRQHLDPAGAHPGGLVHVQHRGHPRQGVLSVPRRAGFRPAWRT